MPRKITDRPSEQPDGYGFTRHGKLNPLADNNAPSPLTRFILDLIRARNISRISPAQVAAQIAASPFASAFNALDLTDWEKLREFRDWRFARATTSSASTIRCNGRNPGHDALEWREGLLIEKAYGAEPETRGEPLGSLFSDLAESKRIPPSWYEPTDYDSNVTAYDPNTGECP